MRVDTTINEILLKVSSVRLIASGSGSGIRDGFGVRRGWRVAFSTTRTGLA